MNPIDRVDQMKKVHEEALNLFKRKNQDYGDSFARYGPIGVVVRLGDKIERLSSITRTGITMVNDESVRDTLIDLHNYAAMAIMLMDEDEKERRLAFCENKKERPSSLPEFDNTVMGDIPSNFFVQTPPPEMLSFFEDQDEAHFSVFRPIDVNKKRD